MVSILYGLLSAFTWGGADFSGGLASRKATAYQVVALNWLAGALLLPIAALLAREAFPSWQDWLWCAAAGVTGIFGLVILYEAMAKGLMGIAASVSAVTAAIVPVAVGAFIDGLPDLATLGGFLLALTAVWLISGQNDSTRSASMKLSAVKLPLLSGVGFGLYFVLMNQGSQQSIFWPMVASRSVSVLLILALMGVKKRRLLPPRPALPLIGLNFLLDNAGTVFFILAGQAGRMDIAAVLSALYPGMTILLAWLLLRERLSRVQWLGIGMALGAIALLAV